MNCPQCGGITLTLHEGVCEECRQDNQSRIDVHFQEFERWRKMTNRQREDEISKAIKL